MHYNNFQEYYAAKRGKIETLKVRIVEERKDEVKAKRGSKVSSDSERKSEGEERQESD